MNKTEMDATYFAKTHPQAVSLEEAVLGAILLDKSGLGRVSFLKKVHFYREEHGDIYAACKSLASKGRGIDILTVMDELKSMKKLDFIGGPAYLAELTHRVASSANAEYHARIIVQQFLLREVIRIGSESARDAYEMGADALEILDNVFKAYVDLRSLEDRREQSALEVTEAVDRESKAIYDRGGKFAGFAFTGIPELDEMIGGLEEGDVIALTGRPKSGKSSFLNAVIRQHIYTNTPGFFASGEMTNVATGLRVISALSGIPSLVLKLGKQHGDPELFEKYIKAKEDMAKAPIHFDDGGFSLARINEFIIQGLDRGCKYFYIDRAELVEEFIKARGGEWSHALKQITSQLRALAVRYKVGIVVFIQGNKEVETTKEKRMEAHHAFGATSIQSDCTKLIAIYRPEMYKMELFEAGPHKGIEAKGKCEIYTLLANSYVNDSVLVGFNGPSQLMYSLAAPAKAGAVAGDVKYNDEDIPF